MKLKSQFGLMATPSNLIHDLSANRMVIVSILSTQRVWPPAIVKSRLFS